jgi:hypothetical protein
MADAYCKYINVAIHYKTAISKRINA